MNFYGSVPGSANFRKRGNSNQPTPFSANLSVYASLYEKIYLGAYYSRLRNIKMGTIIHRGLAVFVSVGCVSHAWEYLCLIMCRNYQWHSGLFGAFLYLKVCICPQKNSTHQVDGSGAGEISLVHERAHLVVMFPSLLSESEWTDIHKINPELNTYAVFTKDKSQMWVSAGELLSGVEEVLANCLCSGWFI